MKELKEKVWFQYMILSLILLLSYCIARVLQLEQNTIQVFMGTILVVILLVALYQKANRRLSMQQVILMVIVAGMVVRIGYMLYTFFLVRSHDMWDVSTKSYGHAAYILNIMEKGRLPQNNNLQFYQQPFFYLVGSMVSFVVNGILQTTASMYYVDATKLVSCFASCAILLHMPWFCKVLKLEEKGTLAATTLVAFLPNMYLAGGRVNPDMLGTYFMFMALLYTLLWYQDSSWKNTIFLAVIYGLGMMTKISCGIMAMVTAGVFLKRGYEAVKEKNLKSFVQKYLAFGCISLPIGLWYAIRNYIQFGQSLTYVLDVSKNVELFVGNHSILSRFLSVSISDIIQSPYVDVTRAYNYPVYLLKTALFGEFRYQTSNAIPYMLMIVTMILVVLMLGSVIYNCIKKKYQGEQMIVLIFSVVLFFSSIWFNVKYPYSCSMDYRYLIPLGITIPVLSCNIVGKHDVNNIQRTSFVTIALYSVLSILLFLCI